MTTAVTTMTCSYQIRAIEPAVAAALRDCDDAGNPPRMVTDHDGGSPLRCCLRSSDRNEPIALVAYAPLRRWAVQTGAEPGPYDEVGPIFIHQRPCRGPAHDATPAELFGAARVFRGYDADGAIVGGRLVAAGERPDRVFEDMFSDPAVALVHVRALEFGCFMFEARRVRADRRP